MSVSLKQFPWTETVVESADTRLFVDDVYQRAEQKSLVREIVAEGWDLVRAGYVVLSQRKSGRLAIIDGQQRWRAARELGVEELLAIVLERLTVEQEADLYFHLNEARKPLSALEKFKGAYGAKKPWARAIHEIVRSYGAGISKVDDTDVHLLVAITKIRDIYNRGGDVELRATLDVIQDAFGIISKDTTQSAFLGGVHMMVTRHSGELDRQRLAKKIKEQGMVALKTRAVSLDRGSATPRGFYLILIDEYNMRLPEKKRIDPKLRGYE